MTNPTVSVIAAARNQGEWVRRTVPRIAESLDGVPHEIIVVDDQSDDGCCHWLPRDVLVMPTPHCYGVSGSRRWGYTQATGEVIIYTDPHCEYEDDTLASLARHALDHRCIVQPMTAHKADGKRYAGAQLTVSDRGLVTTPVAAAAHDPALYNTVYAMRREVHEELDGWPLLPGKWGYSEQALSLLAWLYGVPIEVNDWCFAIHHLYQENGKFPFRVPPEDFGNNAAFVHAALLPETYPTFWRRLLHNRFGASCEKVTTTRDCRRFRDRVLKRRVRNERDFFSQVLDQLYPPDLLSDDGLIANQKRIVRLSRSESRKKRAQTIFRWMLKNLRGCLAGKRCLDVGCREGFGVEILANANALEAEGVELLPDIAQKVDAQIGPTVRQGDVRALPYSDGKWHVVSGSHVLEHLPDPERGRDEMVRVLAPGGWLYVVVPEERVPKAVSGHNACWASEDAFRAWLLDHPGLDGQTYKSERFRTHKDRHEYRALVRKKSRSNGRRRRQSIDGLHVALFTSVAPWQPSTDILEKTVASLTDLFGRQPECHVYCDAAPDWVTPPEKQAYVEYLGGVKRLGLGPLDTAQTHRGLVGAVRQMMADARQPCILHLQHDFELLEPSRIDVEQLLWSLRNNLRTNYVCLLKRSVRERDVTRYTDLWQDVPCDDGTPLTAWTGWSANPHFAKTRHYRKHVMPHLAKATGPDGLAGFEKNVCIAYMRAQRADGFVEAQSRWGVWLYGRIGDGAYCRHLGDAATRWRKSRLSDD